MAQLPGVANCCQTTSCCEETIQVPGPAGDNGSAGTNGTNGVNAYTALTAGFTMPAELANVTVAVGSSAWMTVGQVLFVQTAGHMEVVSKPTTTSAVLKNLEDSATGVYDTNAAPTTAIANGSTISPAGMEGPNGSLTGAAGGDLEGTYPNPRLAITTTVGDLIVNNNDGTAPRNTRLPVGTDGQRLMADSGQATGLIWDEVDLADTTQITGVVATSNGGTGAAGTLTGLVIGDAVDPTQPMTSLKFVNGYDTTVLTNSNVGIQLGLSAENQVFSGTLSGPVLMNLLVTGAQIGGWFWIQLNGVVVSPVNTLTIRDTTAGTLLLFNTNNTINGLLRAIFDGAQWRLMNTNSITLS